MHQSRPSPSTALQDCRILVVEDEYMIAEELIGVLARAGAKTLGPVPQVAAALELIERTDAIDGALLDVNLSNEWVWPVVDALLDRNVPMVLTTGYDANAIPPPYAHLPRCEKPSTGQDLTAALEHAMRVRIRHPN